MRQLGEQGDFPAEPRGAMAPEIGDDLDGHRFVRASIPRTEDLTQATSPYLVLDLEPVGQ
jgi:hypothetical protein